MPKSAAAEKWPLGWFARFCIASISSSCPRRGGAGPTSSTTAPIRFLPSWCQTPLLAPFLLQHGDQKSIHMKLSFKRQQHNKGRKTYPLTSKTHQTGLRCQHGKRRHSCCQPSAPGIASPRCRLGIGDKARAKSASSRSSRCFAWLPTGGLLHCSR